jgi:hypothetical protein
LNWLTYIGLLILLIGWAGLLIIGLFYQFEDDEQNRQHRKYIQKANPDKALESSTPE